MKNERIRNSYGTCFYNAGTTTLNVSKERFVLDKARRFYLFDVIPFGAVRMTKRDTIFLDPNHIDPKKRQRKAVTSYFQFKTTFALQAAQMRFVLGKELDAVYFLPMPETWSEKKKNRMNGMPHESKPDTDNITKAIKDTLKKNDSDVWWEKAEKRWAYRGYIIIYG
jgi:Holliday junction resolvase RusA-like endonuclease